MRVGSLFSGIGGFDLAAHWMGWTTAWWSEVDPYACAVMRKHFPDALEVGDITTLDGTKLEKVDIICGGFPCQDISLAGKGAGIDGERSGLWSHYARIIGEVRPTFAIIENSPALRTRGLGRVLKDLASLGYDAEWHCIPASAVGAPHRRDRIWIVAYPEGFGVEGLRPSGEQEPAPYGAQVLSLCGGKDPLPHAYSERGRGGDTEGQDAKDADTPDQGAGTPVDGSWWAVEPGVGRMANGVPSRIHRIRCLGNAIVPQVAYSIFQNLTKEKL